MRKLLFIACVVFSFLNLSCDNGGMDYSLLDDSGFDDNNNNNVTKVMDYNGNVYSVVKIGNQYWTAENFRGTHYNDGTPIQIQTDTAGWCGTLYGAYCYYNNDISNKQVHGALYNGYAVASGKLAPEGWHVPTYDDWVELGDYIAGGTSWDYVHESLKSDVGWEVAGDNAYGFSGHLSGNRDRYAGFGLAPNATHWWASTYKSSGHFYIASLYCNLFMMGNVEYHYGMSVRFVKD